MTGPDATPIILGALTDAAAYRRHLAGSCPRQCGERGAMCDDCSGNLTAAAEYETLADMLDQPPSPPLPLADDVPTRGLL